MLGVCEVKSGLQVGEVTALFVANRISTAAVIKT
jgi:hypothetical protein